MKSIEKLKLNTIISLINKVAILLSGIILPRFILLFYGSEINGLVSSIQQFLSIVTFLDLGVGAVVQAALYKPLSRNDEKSISMILSSSKRYFRNIAYFLLIYVIFLIVFYPLLINSSLEYISTAILVIALSLNIFGQYYFGIVNELFLNADQKNYIQLSTEIIVCLLNLIVSIFLIMNGFSIQVVKLVSGLVFLIRPVYLGIYVRNNYNIQFDVNSDEEVLPQKWNGVGQHIAYTIQNSTDIVILTIFSTLENVSIYTVYNLVINGIKLILTALTDGITSFYGNLLATENFKQLENYFNNINWLIHTITIYLFGMAFALINSFVKLYTMGVEDINYIVPEFSLLIILSGIFYSLRIPYRRIIFAAGHFKQTQLGSFIEAGINVIISLILVSQMGLVGVAIGTLISVVYHTFYLVIYNSKNIINLSISNFTKHLFVDSLVLLIMILFSTFVFNFITINTMFEWIICAIIFGISFIFFSIYVNLFFYRKYLVYYFKKIIKK